MNTEEFNKHDDKGKLILRKMDIQQRLTEILARVRTGGRLPNHEYANICSEQVRLKGELAGIESKIARINIELHRGAIGNQSNQNRAEIKVERDLNKTAQIIQKLNEVREIYQAFSEDNTRISSMRLMASEFVGHLNRVIRTTINDISKH